VLLAATNRPEILDPALLRAGRFDRQVLVDRPDRRGRVAILEVHLKKVSVGTDVDPDAVAALTPGFTGADLANVVNEAALRATRRGATAVAMVVLSSALSCITAAVVGVVLNLALWFAVHVLFETVGEVHHLGMRFLVPDWSTVRWGSAAIAAAAFVALFRLHWGMIRTLLAAAVAGLVMQLALML